MSKTSPREETQIVLPETISVNVGSLVVESLSSKYGTRARVLIDGVEVTKLRVLELRIAFDEIATVRVTKFVE